MPNTEFVKDPERRQDHVKMGEVEEILFLNAEAFLVGVAVYRYQQDVQEWRSYN